MKRVGLIPLLSAGLFVASTAYAQTFDGDWRGSGGCGIGNIDRYTITLSVQNASVVGTASSFGQKSGSLPDAFAFRGQIDSATGSVALSEAANRYDGKVTGRQMALAGSASGMTCRYTLAYVGASQVAAAPPNLQPAAPAPAVQDQAPPAPLRPAMGQAVPAAKPLPTDAPKPSPPTDPARTAFIGQSAQEMTSVQRALTVLGLYRGDLDGIYGPGTSGAIEAWQRSQGLPPTGYLTMTDSDRLRQQAVARLGGSSAPSIGAQPVAPKPQVAEAETRSVIGTSTIKVGTVFWLSTKGVGRTVVAVTVPQAGLVKIDYRITSASASEFCQRQDQLQPGTTSHRACVEKTLPKNGQVESLVVNCGARTITSSGVLYQRSNDTPLRRDGNEGFWWGTNKNGMLRADEVFRLSCGVGNDSPPNSPNPVRAPNDQSATATPPQSSDTKPAIPSASRQIEWGQLLGTWVPQDTFSAERCSGNSPYPPPDNYVHIISQSRIGLYEGGCDISEAARASANSFRVMMRCGDFNDRSQSRVQSMGISEGRLFIDRTPYVRCNLPGLASTTASPDRTRPGNVPPSQPPATASRQTDSGAGPIKNLAVFNGDCQLQIVSGFFACDPKVAYKQLRNGRSLIVFMVGDAMFTLSGGRDRQPNLENFYLGIDRLRMERKGQTPTEDGSMEGECHFRLNADASKFFFIKCDIYNRSKGSQYAFYLENIRSFSRQPQ